MELILLNLDLETLSIFFIKRLAMNMLYSQFVGYLLIYCYLQHLSYPNYKALILYYLNCLILENLSFIFGKVFTF
jgi:hypothetical protein